MFYKDIWAYFVLLPINRQVYKRCPIRLPISMLLQQALLAKPDAGDVIPGTSGLRKIRVKASGRGKRGGGRVLYKDFAFLNRTYLLFFIIKNKQSDLSNEQKKKISGMIKVIEEGLINGQ